MAEGTAAWFGAVGSLFFFLMWVYYACAVLIVGARVLLADCHPSETFAYRVVSASLSLSLLGSLAVLLRFGGMAGAPVHGEVEFGDWLRIGDFVYHFQHIDGGILQLVRDDWNGFRQVYAGLQNRTLHLAHLDVASEEIARIARRFSLAYVEQGHARGKVVIAIGG